MQVTCLVGKKLSGQNVKQAKCLVGKKLSGQNVKQAKCLVGKKLCRQHVKQENKYQAKVNQQNVTDPFELLLLGGCSTVC